MVFENNFLENYLGKDKIYFFGDWSAKIKPILKENENAFFIDAFTTSATGMIALAEKKFAENDFENIAYFEPFYLKDFVGVNAKKNTI